MESIGWWTIAATLIGPILAVQAQKWVERLQAARGIKEKIFNDIMATRASRLSSEHVGALNKIDLAFYGKGPGKRRKTEQAVLDAWRLYLQRLVERASGEAQEIALGERRTDAFVSLLTAMSKDLGFIFDRVQIETGSYAPNAHEEHYQNAVKIQQSLAKLLSGESSLAVHTPQEIAEKNLAIMKQSNLDLLTGLQKAFKNVFIEEQAMAERKRPSRVASPK